MKKTYQLTADNKEPARVVEAIKNEIRKYIKREKRKTLPEGMNVWNIDCKFAKDDATPETIEFQDITKCIDEAAELNCKSIYLELLSSAIKKERKIVEAATEDEVTTKTYTVTVYMHIWICVCFSILLHCFFILFMSMALALICCLAKTKIIELNIMLVKECLNTIHRSMSCISDLDHTFPSRSKHDLFNCPEYMYVDFIYLYPSTVLF